MSFYLFAIGLAIVLLAGAAVMAACAYEKRFIDLMIKTAKSK